MAQTNAARWVETSGSRKWCGEPTIAKRNCGPPGGVEQASTRTGLRVRCEFVGSRR